MSVWDILANLAIVGRFISTPFFANKLPRGEVGCRVETT
jgi:hypothetical protein